MRSCKDSTSRRPPFLIEKTRKDGDKVKLYNQVLQRYNYLSDQRGKQPTRVAVVNNDAATATATPRKLIRAISRSLAGIAVRQRVKLNYSDITQKVSVHMSPSTEFTTQGSMGVILGNDTRTIRSPENRVPLDGDGEVYTFMKEGDSVVDMTQGFASQTSWNRASSATISTAVEDRSDTRRARTYDLETFRARAVHALVAQGVWNNRNRYKRRHRACRAIRTRQGDGDASFSTSQDRSVLKNELQRLLHPTGGRRSTLLCRCQNAARTGVG